MALIVKLNKTIPKIGKDCFLAENATIIGEVIIGNNCSIWFNVVVRGDVNSIQIGNNVNIQDGAIVHCTYDLSKTIIGDNVSIGHNAIIHGCTIENNVLIGMGAIVLDNAIVQENSFVAAGAVVLANTTVESDYLYAGTPAKKVKKLTPDLLEMIRSTPEAYINYASWYK
ncbi:MAG: gamma carbonic anhydrase family protein [Bacteroidia bacterium]|nr:gamma carbonic anhydrase family protein [Bacteroidia bacterium]